MRNVSSLVESNIQVKDYRELGLTFEVPKAVTPPGTRGLVQAIDDVAVVNRDYDFEVKYSDLPEFYDKFVATNQINNNLYNNRYRGGFKSDDNQFRLAVEIPLLETIIFVEMSANSIWVVTRKVVGGDVVETARWSNDPYRTEFMFSTNGPGQVVFTNTDTFVNSTPMRRLGRPFRNSVNNKWYIPLEQFSTGGGSQGRLYELDEATGTLSTLTTNKIFGGYQLRVTNIVTKANKAGYLTMQSGSMYPSLWSFRTYLNNPAAFFWKNKILMIDKDGVLNYNTTDYATYTTIPAPPTGAMFYIVDDTDRDNRLIAAGVDTGSSNRNIVIWELRSIGGAWTKIGTLVGAAFANGYTGKLTGGNGAVNDVTPTGAVIVPNLGSIVAGGAQTFQYWFPSGTVSINQDEGSSFSRLNINFAYWHSGLYGGGPFTTVEGAIPVTTSDSYMTMLQAPLLQPTDSTFSTDVDNTSYLGIRRQFTGWGVVSDNSVNLNTSYINIEAEYGAIYGAKHFMFVNNFQHWQTSGKFPIYNNQITEDSIDAFKFVPSYIPASEFPGYLFPAFSAKILARRMVIPYDKASNFYIKNDYNRVDFFNTIPHNAVDGTPNYRSFCEMLDVKALKADTVSGFTSGNFGASAGIIATGDNETVNDIRGITWGGVFSGPNAKTIGIQTPGRIGDGIPAFSSYVWLLGSNLNRKEPFILNKIPHPVESNNKTLFTIVG